MNQVIKLMQLDFVIMNSNTFPSNPNQQTRTFTTPANTQMITASSDGRQFKVQEIVLRALCPKLNERAAADQEFTFENGQVLCGCVMRESGDEVAKLLDEAYDKIAFSEAKDDLGATTKRTEDLTMEEKSEDELALEASAVARRAIHREIARLERNSERRARRRGCGERGEA
ncbi:uncharacterized protein LTR77_002299 [Saxophila tyrrhenica]|uniref:Uncharacterized protein n=1 Tax=Saxophila tyrrhenica TaxID=1690608 RepID=A0AAV9PMZ2_9PEZI|nr:hypothetical protein LTR77_002299 [Saxophila tyrrhenica]